MRRARHAASRPTGPKRCTSCAPRRDTSSSARRRTAPSRRTTRVSAGRSAGTSADFVGKRSLARPAMHATDRRQLVGLLTKDPAVVLEEGAQVVAAPAQAPPMRLIGHVTSSYASAALASLDRARADRGRSRADRTDALRADAGRRHTRRGHGTGLLRRGRNTTPWLMPSPAFPSRSARRSGCSCRAVAAKFVFRGDARRGTRLARCSGRRWPRFPAAQ